MRGRRMWDREKMRWEEGWNERRGRRWEEREKEIRGKVEGEKEEERGEMTVLPVPPTKIIFTLEVHFKLLMRGVHYRGQLCIFNKIQFFSNVYIHFWKQWLCLTDALTHFSKLYTHFKKLHILWAKGTKSFKITTTSFKMVYLCQNCWHNHYMNIHKNPCFSHCANKLNTQLSCVWLSLMQDNK